MAVVKIFEYEAKDSQDESDRKISEIAESQKRTENRIEGLILGQKESDRKFSTFEKKMEEFADAQRELAQSLRELSQSQKELAEEQKQTKQSIKELADETKQSIKELADAQKRTEKEVAKLSSGLNGVRHQIGGLSKSVAYALENEAFRKLPAYLKNRFQIEVKERLIRTSVGIKEINVFAKAQQNGNEVIIVGECVLKLDDRSKLGQLEESIEIVKQQYHQPVVPLLITHFVQSDIFKKVSEEGIIVVQSFEWD